MAEAKRDSNRVPTLIGVSSLDLSTPANVAVNPTTGEVLVEADLNAVDIEIGAVEIKNSTDDTRATVDSDGLSVSVKKSVIPTGAATAAKQLADGHSVALSATDNTVLDNILLEGQKINSLVPAVFDYIALTYTDTDLTSVVYKTGGSIGTTVSTLTLAYTAHILQTVTKT